MIRFMKQIEISHELRKLGIKNTKNKSAILRALKEVGRPISANGLHHRCTETTPMNLATVYRTLQQFEKGGLLRALPGGEGTLLYEYSGAEALEHPHFRCERCNELFCLDPLDFDDALFFSALAGKHEVRQVRLLLSGLCARCRAELDAAQGSVA